VIFNSMLSFFDDPGIRYKIAVMFQLETETKARLRPTLLQWGLDITEQDESRQADLAVAASLEGKSWLECMSSLSDVVKPYVERYRQIATEAPAEYRAVAESMAVHGASLYDFIELELGGGDDKVASPRFRPSRLVRDCT
jgi:hypothetical protein